MTYAYAVDPSEHALNSALLDILQRIEAKVDERAAFAKAEAHAMAVRDRRSIGQLTRLDHFWRRAGK